MAQKQYFDIAVIGSGPGGYVAAITSAQKGKKVCLIEKNEIGGTCLNIGCIPTKCLLATANILDKIQHADHFGIEIEQISPDFSKIKKRKDDVVENIRRNLENLIKSNKIFTYIGEASFISQNELWLNGKEKITIQADKIIIATGSKPSEIKKFPFDNEFIHSSTSILSLKKLPKSIAIVGGGYIGCEFASFFNALGVKVTIIEAQESIISTQEKEIIQALLKIFANKGIDVLASTKVTDIEKKKDHLVINLDNNKQLKSDICLLSVGRKVCTDNLNIEKAKVDVNTDGSIIVNEKMQTNVPHIYAIGDVTGKIMLAHVASHQGIVAANNAIGNEMNMRYDAIPAVIFTIPEIATVGLCKKEAEARGYDIIYSSYPLNYLGKSKASNEVEGFVSLVIEKETKQVLGASMIGADASTMISEMALAVNNELTLDCIIDTIHAHPTLSEAWFESALLANKTPIHHPPIKK